MQSKIEVCITHGCALYTGKYGTYIPTYIPLPRGAFQGQWTQSRHNRTFNTKNTNWPIYKSAEKCLEPGISACQGKLPSIFKAHWSDKKIHSFLPGHSCEVPGCNNVLVLDGKMKNASQVCSCKDIGELQYAGMEGTVVVGMSQSTQWQISWFCQKHHEMLSR